MTKLNFFQTPYKALYCLCKETTGTMTAIKPTDEDIKAVRGNGGIHDREIKGVYKFRCEHCKKEVLGVNRDELLNNGSKPLKNHGNN